MSTKLLQSTIGRKVLAAISGLALVGFIVVHLAGNLTLLLPDGGAAFNAYAHKLASLGPLLWVARAGLLVFFVTHVLLAIGVRLDEKRARPEKYAVTATKGGPSKQTWSSRSMLVTGVVILLFVPFHVWMFTLNQGTPHATVEVHGEPVKDVYLAVVTAFNNPVKAWAYVAVMVILGFHLRHGFWSAFQSLGVLCPKWTPAVYTTGIVFAALMALGFLVLPLYMLYFGPDPESLRAVVAGP
jgi:succinate dehydrogenase / fumarate reductase cytochrome b subunit